MPQPKMESKIRLRPAAEKDKRLLFEWRNDSQTRAMSFDPCLISWKQHCNWFMDNLTDPPLIWVAVVGDTPVGSIRFDTDDCINVNVGVVVAPEWRGKGLAAEIIRKGIDLMRPRFLARIKHENVASKKAFLRAGFEVLAVKGDHMVMKMDCR